jgi:hypothetical protein
METIIITVQVAGLSDEEQLQLKRAIQELLSKYTDKRIDVQIINGRTF